MQIEELKQSSKYLEVMILRLGKIKSKGGMILDGLVDHVKGYLNLDTIQSISEAEDEGRTYYQASQGKDRILFRSLKDEPFQEYDGALNDLVMPSEKIHHINNVIQPKDFTVREEIE